jgi:hypothetical protein
MASGYGISADSKDLLVVGGVVVALALIAWYIISHVGDPIQSAGEGIEDAIGAVATGIGNVPGDIGVEPSGQLYTDLYNWWEGLGQS